MPRDHRISRIGSDLAGVGNMAHLLGMVAAKSILPVLVCPFDPGRSTGGIAGGSSS